MLDLVFLLWRFLQAQPPAMFVAVMSWHLLVVMGLLAVFSAFGLHFVIGYLFGFYRRNQVHARWMAWPTLPLLLVSVLALVGCYLLGLRGPQLVRANITPGVAEELGRRLLAPAFGSPALAAVPADAVSKEAIKTALSTASELEYRARLAGALAENEAFASAEGGGSGGASGPDLAVQIGLRWVAHPPAGAITALPQSGAGDAPPGAGMGQPFFLPEFLAGLVEELPAGTELPRLEWEHVAGTRFTETVVRPLLEEYLSYLAVGLAAAVLLADGLYFLVMRRFKRIGANRAARKAAAAALGAAPPSAVPDAPAPAAAPVPVAAAPAGPPLAIGETTPPAGGSPV